MKSSKIIPVDANAGSKRKVNIPRNSYIFFCLQMFVKCSFILKYRVENPRGHLRALRLNLLPSRPLCAPRWIARRWYPKRGGNIQKPDVQRELRRAVCYRVKWRRGGERMGLFLTFPPCFGYHRRANDRGLLEEQEGNRFKRSARKWPLGFSTR